MNNLLRFIISKTQLPETSVKNTITLLNEDCTIPFISRYRKEATGNLDEVQIGDIVKYKEQFEALEKRKAAILKVLEDQDVLTQELKSKIETCTDLTTLEDLYLPYKKKRKTKAETARKNGLEPLAKIIMSQNTKDIESVAFKYIKGEITSTEHALEGARHIIAEWINERTDVRNNIRNQLERYAIISTKVIKTKKEDEKAQKFRDYFEWEESLNRIPSHRLLAILRAESEGFIRVKIEIDNERAIQKIENKMIRSQNDCAAQMELAIADAYKRLLLPSLSNEALQNAKDKADESAI
ncbi:MAG: RNA-binding transcriptional accessory protein, partial [Oceanihabitans sp.]|nr:RNA-binding transcriptional accessory protein [Oceanihabitans sp.]